MRCTSCRYSETESLPDLDKKVIYLDQSIFSILFRVASGGRLPPGHEDFSKELFRKLRKLVLLQQIVLPHSNLHSDETIVFQSPEELRKAYEILGGDIAFTNSYDVEASQIFEFCSAYIEKREPKINFDVDEVLENEKDVWLSDMHIGIQSDYSRFADGIRSNRDRTNDAMQELFAHWSREKPAFDSVVDRELKAFGTSRRKILLSAVKRSIEAASAGDSMAIFSIMHESIMEEAEMLRSLFEKNGVAAIQQGNEVNMFWQWEGNRGLPHLRISAYFFAAFARRAAQGQKKITRGLMIDVTSIATYAPYVDAMVVDQECANLLAEKPLATDLKYKARIFSLGNPDELLEYLDELEKNVPRQVHEFATRIYKL